MLCNLLSSSFPKLQLLDLSRNFMPPAFTNVAERSVMHKNLKAPLPVPTRTDFNEATFDTWHWLVTEPLMLLRLLLVRRAIAVVTGFIPLVETTSQCTSANATSVGGFGGSKDGPSNGSRVTGALSESLAYDGPMLEVVLSAAENKENGEFNGIGWYSCKNNPKYGLSTMTMTVTASEAREALLVRLQKLSYRHNDLGTSRRAACCVLRAACCVLHRLRDDCCTDTARFFQMTMRSASCQSRTSTP
jgi:hypothetical protein